MAQINFFGTGLDDSETPPAAPGQSPSPAPAPPQQPPAYPAPTASPAPSGNPWDAYTQHPFFQQIQQAYQRYFGRTPGGSEVWDRLGNGRELNPANLQRQLQDIATSYWASDYRDRGAGYAPTAAPGSAGGAASGFNRATWNDLTSKYPGTVAGLDQLVREHPELGLNIVGGSRGDIQYADPSGQHTVDVLKAAGLGGQGWQWDEGGGMPQSSYMAAYASPAGAQFNDPSTKRMEEYVNQLIAQLQQPPFTGPQQEVLRTQALDPIEHDRQAAHQRALNNIGARGFDPTSGIAQQLLNDVDATFDTQRASAQNQLAYHTIGQQKANQQEVLQLLNLLYQLPRNSMNDALSVLGYQPNYGGLANGYAQLGMMNNANSSANGQWLGSLLAYLLR